MEPKRNKRVLVTDKGGWLEVWAGVGQVELLQSIEGVHAAYEDTGGGTKYTVFLDKRYDPMSVIAVIGETLEG